MAPEDLSAIVAYLKTVPPQAEPQQARPTSDFGKPSNIEPALRGTSGPNERDSLRSGAALFSGNCASCHQPNGGGSRSQFYPALFGNTTTGSVHPDNLVAAILFGVERTVEGQQVLMPRFDKDSHVNPLSDAQIAAISTYVLNQFGNSKLTVTPADVQTVRNGGDVPLLVKAQPWFIPAGIAGLLLVLAAIAWLVRRRRAVK
jgi:mono/diheme cytochrome c family protein